MIHDCTNEEIWPLVLDNDAVHVILVYGATCGPCVKTKPHYEMVSSFFNKLDPSICFYQIDIWNDINKGFHNVNSIASVPTLLIYKNNAEIGRVTGSQESLQIRDFIQRTLNENI